MPINFKTLRTLRDFLINVIFMLVLLLSIKLSGVCSKENQGFNLIINLI